MAVPKLRFKEFCNSWDEVKTGDIFENVVDKGYTDKMVFTIVQGIGTVPRAESGRNMIYDEKSISGYKKVNKNDFIIHLRSFEGGLEKANGEGLVSPAYTVLRPKNKVATAFLYDYFHTKKFVNGILAKAVEGIRDGRQISYNMFKWLKIPFPDYAEQQKIAEFLTTFDKRIAAQQNIIADLEETKKGLLQKIFSQEIRFKDDNGQEFPDWKEKRLGAICQIFKGAPLSKSDISDEGKPFILYGELYTTYSEVAYDIVRKTRTSVDERYCSEVGDVLVPTSGESAEEISTATCVMQKGVILAGDLNVVRSGVIDGRILSYMLNHTKKHELSRVAQGISVVHSKAEDLKKLIISIPAVEEQRKIADFLSTFDKKISAEKQILSDLQEIKRGLLQQMFV